jgi:hypothetical protein
MGPRIIFSAFLPMIYRRFPAVRRFSDAVLFAPSQYRPSDLPPAVHEEVGMGMGLDVGEGFGSGSAGGDIDESTSAMLDRLIHDLHGVPFRDASLWALLQQKCGR